MKDLIIWMKKLPGEEGGCFRNGRDGRGLLLLLPPYFHSIESAL